MERLVQYFSGHHLAGKPGLAPPCVELKDIVKRSAQKVQNYYYYYFWTRSSLANGNDCFLLFSISQVDSIFAILTEDVSKDLTGR